MTLGEFLNFSDLTFLTCKMGVITTYLPELWSFRERTQNTLGTMLSGEKNVPYY